MQLLDLWVDREVDMDIAIASSPYAAPSLMPVLWVAPLNEGPWDKDDPIHSTTE